VGQETCLTIRAKEAFAAYKSGLGRQIIDALIFEAERVPPLEDELDRQKAKTEYEAERAGNIANDLDEAIAVLKELLFYAFEEANPDVVKQARAVIAKAGGEN
jgi:hypothetical protein